MYIFQYNYINTDNDGNGKHKQGLRNKLTAANGKQFDASTVFVEAFKHIKSIVFDYIAGHAKKNGIRNLKINDIYDIQWIVTIPAIWDDIAKNKMITWIKDAELIDDTIKNHCILKYEPDCASLSLQHQLLNENNQMNDGNLFDLDEKVDNKVNDINDLIGKKYMIIDAGGGTVDIGCHEFMENCSVKELHYPTGGPWGDICVDEAFENLLRCLLGCIYIKSNKIKIHDRLIDTISQYYKNKVSRNDLLKRVFGNAMFAELGELMLSLLENILEEHEDSIFTKKETIYILIGTYILQNIKKKDQNVFFNLVAKFRDAKIKFSGKQTDSKMIITISDDFVDAMDAEFGDGNFKTIITQCQLDIYKGCFSVNQDSLCINGIIFEKYLFDPLMTNVIKQMRHLLSKSIMNNCSYIYLVGGYSKTPYFQNKIINKFGLNSQYNIDVIIPSKPLLSVVDGAARMGLLNNINRQYVKIRILSKTYGCGINKPYDNINLDDYPDEYSTNPKNSFISPLNGKKYLINCFKIYAKKEDAVAVNQQFKFFGYRSHKTHMNVLIEFYSSNKKDPKLISDGTKLAEYNIIWPKNNDSCKVTTEIIFGGEMIEAISYPTNMPHIKLETKFKYQWK